MLIDRVLPNFQFVERHAVTVPAPPAVVYRALWEVDFARSPTIRILFRARGLRPRFRQGRHRMRARLNDFLDVGFLLLGERPGEEVVIGTVWGRGKSTVDSVGYAELAGPGHVKVAMNFTVEPRDAGTQLATETRVYATDPKTRRTFARYWLIICPFSALIRRRMLTLLQTAAAHTTSPTTEHRTAQP
jgi:hypothetical protein